MRILFLAATLLAACARSARIAPSADPAPVLSYRQSFTCPLPASTGFIKVTPDGAAERVVFDGLQFEPGKSKSTREVLTLPAKDAAELFKLVESSGYEDMPERPERFLLKPYDNVCADCCSGNVEIRTKTRTHTAGFSGERSGGVDVLMKHVSEILGRGTWTTVVYPREKKR